MSTLESRLAEHPDVTNEPSSPTPAVVTALPVQRQEQHSNAIEVHSHQRLSDENLDLIKRTLAADANLSNAELKLFSEVASRKGLDPFAGQIHAVKRQGRLTFQTGIDGFRLMAQRTGLYAGQDSPQWCGEDGQWKDIWVSKTPPVACRLTVYRKDWERGLTVIAHWEEYVQKTKDGSVNSMWRQRGPAQLAKCTEALAIRKAFPEALSGIYTNEEMGQADNPITTPPELQQSNAPAMQEHTVSDPLEASNSDKQRVREAIGTLTDQA
jgi:phage recombination protein Bet